MVLCGREDHLILQGLALQELAEPDASGSHLGTGVVIQNVNDALGVHAFGLRQREIGRFCLQRTLVVVVHMNVGCHRLRERQQ